MENQVIPLRYLRTTITALVVAFHAFLAYVSLFPQKVSGFAIRAFPILDHQRWGGFDVFFGFNDIYFMALMFLVSGIFVWGGLRRKGAGNYIRSRLIRLGVPFVFTAYLLIPLAYYPSYLWTTADATVADFYHRWLALSYWPSGPAWFLAVLFAFDVIAAVLFKLIGSRGARPGTSNTGAHSSAALVFAGIVALTFIAYFPMRQAFGPLHWAVFGPFQVQSSRVLLYLAYFLVGVALGARGTERGLLAANGKLAKQWAIWLVAAPILFVVYIVLLMKTGGPRAMPAAGQTAVVSLAFVLSCAASSFFLLATFLRFATRRIRFLDLLSTNAYGIYLVHYVFVVWVQYALLDVQVSAFAKGMIAFLGALILSLVTSMLGRRVMKQFGWQLKPRKVQVEA